MSDNKITGQWPVIPEHPDALEKFHQFMRVHNIVILYMVEVATNELESQSIARLTQLRLIQYIAFSLSFCNFLLILYLMHQSEQRAHKEALTDPLTRLRNRAGIYQELDRCVAEFIKSGKPFNLILFDLDDFKHVNDTYGHVSGDALLKEVSQSVMVWMKSNWIAGRLGGDEFVII